MFKNKQRDRWEATSELHFIGWETIRVLAVPDQFGFYPVKVKNKSDGEERTVYATRQAIPVGSIERIYRR